MGVSRSDRPRERPANGARVTPCQPVFARAFAARRGDVVDSSRRRDACSSKASAFCGTSAVASTVQRCAAPTYTRSTCAPNASRTWSRPRTSTARLFTASLRAWYSPERLAVIARAVTNPLAEPGQPRDLENYAAGRRSAAMSTERPRHGELAAAISNTVVQAFARTTGRGPTKARTTLSDNAVFVALQDSPPAASRRSRTLARATRRTTPRSLPARCGTSTAGRKCDSQEM
jgi:hypothetical protein